MDSYFAFFPWYVTAFFLVIGINLLVYIGFRWVRNNVPSELIRANHDVASYTLNILGLMYAVLIGFTIVNVQGRFDEVDHNVHTEANILLNLFRDASALPKKNRDAIRKEIRTYVDQVVSREWSDMENHDQQHLHSPLHLHNLWQSYYDVEPISPKDQIWYRVSVDKLNDLNNARLERLFSSEQKLGPFMWTLLLVGGFCLVIFMYFFSAPSLLAQFCMASVIAGNIVFMLFLIYSLDTVFTGSIKVDSTAFEFLQNSFDLWEKL